MASKKRYKSSEEVLGLLFSLPIDVSETEDDLESSDTEPSTSTTETYVQNVSHTSRSSPTFSEHSSDDDDDDVLYRLAYSNSSEVESHSTFESASDDVESDSDLDETSWTKGKFPSISVDFDAIKVCPALSFIDPHDDYHSYYILHVQTHLSQRFDT